MDSLSIEVNKGGRPSIDYQCRVKENRVIVGIPSAVSIVSSFVPV
jgi:hypothetical protein